VNEVEKVQALLDSQKGSKGALVTVYNETLEEHVNRPSTETMAFAAPYAAANPDSLVEPPSFVWLTSEARPHEKKKEASVTGETEVTDEWLQSLQSAVDRGVAGLVGANGQATICLSYPVYLHTPTEIWKDIPGLLTVSLANAVDGAPWDAVDLLGYLSGLELAGEIRISNNTIEQIKNRTKKTLQNTNPKGKYYSALAKVFAGPQVLQSRILTAGLFARLAGQAPGLWPVVQKALGEPLADFVKSGYRQQGNEFSAAVNARNVADIKWAADQSVDLQVLQAMWPRIQA
jgi:hypothetical protein